MTILIYTSNIRGAVNDYNIGELIHAKPQHRYVFVVVSKELSYEKINFFTRFKRLYIRIRDGRNHWRPYLRMHETKVRQICKKYDLKNYHVEYVSQVNSIDSQRVLSNINPDIILQAGAGILKESIFSIAKIATINIHHGLAPEVRGMKSTFWCLYYGLFHLIGVTCHVIDKTLDTGSIIKRYNYKYKAGDSLEKIETELCIKGAQLLIESIEKLENENFSEISEYVDSYYFGYLHYKLYSDLLAKNFCQVKSSENLLTKLKKRTFLVPNK